MRHVQHFESGYHVDRRNIPFQVAFAKVYENIVSLVLKFFQLAIGMQLIQKYRVDCVVGQKGGQIAGRVIVFVIY
jgi:hypothetical protein